MKRFLLLLLTACAASAQVTTAIDDVGWPASSASQLFRRNAAGNGYEFFTASPVLTATGDATGSATLTNLGSATLALTLPASGVTAGTYKSVTVDTKGRVSAGTNPTTLSGFGITDAQPLDSDLTSIAALTTTSFGRSLLVLVAANNAVLTTDGAGAWVLASTLPAVSGANLTALNAANLGSGFVPAARMPALTGDVTTTAGAVATTLSTTGVTAGTYKSVTVDSKGRVSAGTNPTTLSGYGITDALGAPMRNTLAPRGGVALDGTAGARIFSTLTSQNIGADAFSVVCVLRVPASAPAASQGIWGLGSSLSDFVSSSGPNASLSLDAAGGLDISIGRSSGVYIASTVAGFVTKYAGKVVTIAAVFDRVSVDPLIYIDGSAQVAARLFSQGAAWTDSITSTYFGLGWQDTSQGSRYVGAIYAATVYNFALSASDQLEITELGGGVPERHKWSSQSALYVSNYSAGTDNWSSDTSQGGDATGNIDTSADGVGTPPSDDWLRCRRLSTSGQLYAFRSTAVSGLVSGKVARYSADLFIPASASYGYIRVGSVNGSLAAGTVAVTAVTKGAVMHVDLPFLYPGNGLQVLACDVNGLAASCAVGDALYQKNVVIRQAGALAHYSFDDGLGYQLADASTNRLHAIATPTGVAHVAAKQRGVLRFTTATNGNQQILGQTALPPNARITSWTIDSSGSATVSLGNASAGAQFLSAGSITTGLNDVTLLTRFCPTQQLWVGSNSTATLQHTVFYEVVD